MKSERLSRGLENRTADKKDDRRKYNMAYVSSLHIPDYIKKDGFDYYWERTGIRGQLDSALDSSLRRGWKPVPLDRDPERFTDILERNPLSRKFICQGDVILLEREQVLSEREKESEDKVSRERLTTSPAYNYKNPLNHNIGTVR